MNIRMEAPDNGVKIRMYRQGLGDCFLLAFKGRDDKDRYIMIDCGVIIGTRNAERKMTQVAENIKSATEGRIDVLVLTHEHWDHVSGFVQAQETLKSLNVGEVWLAWTENPKDALAKELKEKKNRCKMALMHAMKKLDEAEKSGYASAFSRRILSLQSFYGEGELLGASKGGTTADAFRIAQKNREVKYCYPGMGPLQLDGVDNSRIFVLGPPRDKKLIRRSRPSSKPGEVYRADLFITDFFLDKYDAYISDLLGSDSDSSSPEESSQKILPFNEHYRLNQSDPAIVSFAQAYYEKDEWRKIDDNWLEAAGELALQLDSHTNNTCLVLAIELSPDGKVLLFPGDAQVGNWQSWGDVKWSINGSQISGDDLLERTVLYKVGHHGSHNATLQDEGLELMTDNDLMAMIPVDEKMAERKRWHMPHKPLYKRLKEKTQERILRVDQGMIKPESASSQEWKNFKDIVKVEKLYLELTVSP